MNVNRKVLRSIGEWSVFKYLIVSYLIFFVLCLVGLGIAGLVAWLGLSSYGINFQEMLKNVGIDLSMITGGGWINIILFIIIGLVASAFYAAIGTFALWIMNVIFKITGGIELRFSEQEQTKKQD